MQFVRSFEPEAATQVSWAMRILVLSSEGESGILGRRLAGLGGTVEACDELFKALSDIIEDPSGYGLFVIDCDSANVGGLEAAQRAIQLVGEAACRVPVILISHECHEQRFPMERRVPVILRAPLSAVSLKVGFEHALRDRLMFEAA